MSKGNWKAPPHRRPRTRSIDIPSGEWLSQQNVLGSQQFKLPPMFKMNREELEAVIEAGLFPVPMRVLGTGPRGQLLWPSDTIKEYVQDCEREQAAAPVPLSIPAGWSTTADLVKLLGVSRQSIHLYVKVGKLAKPQRFGGRPAWSPEQIEAMRKWRLPSAPLPFADAVDESKYVSVKVFEARLGISGDRLQELILAGKIPPPVIVNGYGVYPRTVLERLEREGL